MESVTKSSIFIALENGLKLPVQKTKEAGDVPDVNLYGKLHPETTDVSVEKFLILYMIVVILLTLVANLAASL